MKTLLALLVLPGIAAAQTTPESESFDTGVLTPKAREAYRSLLSMHSAFGTRVGIAGHGNPEAPLYYVWDDPRGEEALRALLVEASPAGRFLALCGLHPFNPVQYRASCELLAGDQELVTVYPGGCVGHSQPLGEAVELHVQKMATSLRRHWEITRLARHFEPSPGYEQNLSPAGRQAMEILRAASYVDGSYWIAVEDAIGPMRALHDLLDEEVAADALVDLIHSANPAGRVYGAGGLFLACGEAIPRALELLESDTDTVRLEIEGRIHELSVAEAAELLLTRSRSWTRGLYERRKQRERERRGADGSSPFQRDRLTPEQREAYDALARAEAVQLCRWQEHLPSTRALLTMWDAEDAARAFELLTATASPAGRLLALCGLRVLDPDRARRVDLALRKSGLMVRMFASDGPYDVPMEVAVQALASDGTLPKRLRSEWGSARRGGAQEDPRRELSGYDYRHLPTLRPSGDIENPFRLAKSGFGVGLARTGDQLLVGASVFIDPKQRGAVFVLRPSGDDWSPAQTILPSSQSLGFGDLIAASDSTLVIVRKGGTYGNNETVEGAAEVYEKADDGWARVAELEIGKNWIADLAVTGETALVVGQKSAFVLQRGPARWERRDMTMPEGTQYWTTGIVDADGNRVALGHVGGVSVFERTEDGWTSTAHLTQGEGGPFGFISSLALEGGRLLVGDLGESRAFRDGGEGSVVAFEERHGRWVPTQTLRGSDALPGDCFGDCLALDGDRLVVLGRRGPARLFELEDELWRERAKFIAGVGTPTEPVAYDALCTGVCDLSGDRLLIGMPRWSEGSGKVAVFDVAAALERARW